MIWHIEYLVERLGIDGVGFGFRILMGGLRRPRNWGM